ncbi:hypothetical protein AYI70_g5579 [Smittium culicis]|uniref:Uncharacterized protein n=1 Tax=Smittium culicis TaxID=133412 RepID=A0A1R1XTY8_9FUNG|nr:hypothetical protein AYI70_g5579 [Smittium culicis]
MGFHNFINITFLKNAKRYKFSGLSQNPCIGKFAYKKISGLKAGSLFTRGDPYLLTKNFALSQHASYSTGPKPSNSFFFNSSRSNFILNIKKQIFGKLDSLLTNLSNSITFKKIATKLGNASPGPTPNRLINFLLKFHEKYSIKPAQAKVNISARPAINRNVLFRNKNINLNYSWKHKLINLSRNYRFTAPKANLFKELPKAQFKNFTFSNSRFSSHNSWASLFNNFRSQLNSKASTFAFNLRSSLNHQSLLSTLSDGRLIFLKYSGAEGPNRFQKTISSSKSRHIVSTLVPKKPRLDKTRFIKNTSPKKATQNIPTQIEKKHHQIWSTKATLPNDRIVLIVPLLPQNKKLDLDLFVDENSVHFSDLTALTDKILKVNNDQILYVNRLLERLSSSNLELIYVNLGTGNIAIIFNSLAQVNDTNTLLGLLFSWGMDLESLGAEIKAPAEQNAICNDNVYDNSLISYKGSFSLNSHQILSEVEFERLLDNSLFSFITEDVVDPDELYKFNVYKFLDSIESAPQLSIPNYNQSSLALF